MANGASAVMTVLLTDRTDVVLKAGAASGVFGAAYLHPPVKSKDRPTAAPIKIPIVSYLKKREMSIVRPAFSQKKTANKRKAAAGCVPAAALSRWCSLHWGEQRRFGYNPRPETQPFSSCSDAPFNSLPGRHVTLPGQSGRSTFSVSPSPLPPEVAKGTMVLPEKS